MDTVFIMLDPELHRCFITNTTALYGDAGTAWLQSLPALLDRFANQYALSQLNPINHLSFNFVASGVQQGNQIIIKLGLNEKALAKEATCLTAFDKHGGVTLIAHEPGMLLLQRACPGTPLRSTFPHHDWEATRITCQQIATLHQSAIPSSHAFSDLSEILSVLDHSLAIPTHVILRARQLRDHLLATTQHPVLLHGDLHHDNVLRHDDGWLAIDPKGFIGDPVFDVCAFIHNPIPELLQVDQPANIISARIQWCSDILHMDKQRILDWLYVKSVLCWAWCLNDNLNPNHFSTFTTLLNDIQ